MNHSTANEASGLRALLSNAQTSVFAKATHESAAFQSNELITGKLRIGVAIRDADQLARQIEDCL